MADVEITAALKGTQQISAGLKTVQTSIAQVGKAAQKTAANSNQLATGFGRATQAAKQFGGAMQRAGQSMAATGKQISSVGKSLTIGLTLPIVAAGAAMLKFAIDAVESENLFNVAMGDMRDAAREFSEDLRRQLGLNAFEVRRQIATFFQMTSAMGIAREAAFEMSTGLTQLTGDLASFFNLRPEEAFAKLQSGIAGEIEPLRRLGVDVSETTVKLTLMKAGLIGASDELSNQQKILGRYLTIVEQTKNAQGDLARTIQDPANRLRVLRSRLEETAISFGQQLLPAFNAFLSNVAGPLVGAIQELVRLFSELSPTTQSAVIAVAALAAATGPLLFVFGGFLRILGPVITALGAFVKIIVSGQLLGALKLLRSRVAAIAGALAAVGVVLVFATGKFEEFQDKLGDVIDDLSERFKKLSIFEDLEASSEDTLTAVTENFRKAFGDAADGSTKELKKLQREMDKANEAARKAAVDLGLIQADTAEEAIQAMIKQQQFAQRTTAQMIDLGQRELSATTELLQQQIAETRAASEEIAGFQIQNIEAVANRELELRSQLISVTRQQAQEQVALISQTAGLTREQLITALEELRIQFGLLGPEAFQAIELINQKIIELDVNALTFTEGFKKGIIELAENIKSFGEQAAESFGSFVGTIETQLAGFFETGELQFGNFIDTMRKKLAEFLASQVVQAVIKLIASFSSGGLGGGIGGGGIFSALSGVFGFQGGGHVKGPGTGTSDSIPALLSRGEFVINARAAQKNLSLLQSINRGVVQSFRKGGQAQRLQVGGLVGASPGFREQTLPAAQTASGNVIIQGPIITSDLSLTRFTRRLAAAQESERRRRFGR